MKNMKQRGIPLLEAVEEKLIGSLDKDEIVSLVRDLVRLDSVIRPDSGNTESRVVSFIAEWVRANLGTEPVIEEAAPGRENIIVTLDWDRPGPALLLEGHTDVVSEGRRETWTHEPFGAEIAENRIYGRGSCDMKAGLAVNLLTAKALLALRERLKGRLRLAIVCDEEGMMIGIKHFIARGWADGIDACLVSEPEENQLCLSMKGALRALVTVKGKMAHGAMPRTGINPNVPLARIILAFHEFESKEIERCGSHEYLGFPSVTFTVIQSPPPPEPPQLNVMPGTAFGYVDIRTIPAQDHEILKGRLRDILAQVHRDDPSCILDIYFIEDRPVVTLDREDPIVRLAAGAFQDITGKKPVYNGVPGATDGTFLRARKNIPCLVNGPGPRHKPHQSDEYVDIDELYDALRIYALTGFRFFS
ncbi:MAG: M20 family peptidase [Spirochaetales bacterium]|nr:MAG: M20 family peptidase [Spirochaetales bacterium]